MRFYLSFAVLLSMSQVPVLSQELGPCGGFFLDLREGERGVRDGAAKPKIRITQELRCVRVSGSATG